MDYTELYECQQLCVERSIDAEISRGVVFSNKPRIRNLCKYGYLVLMDSTHKTNVLSWQLYTLMVRSNEGSWLPVAWFYTEKADGDIIRESLKTIRAWCRPFGGWRLRYSITDDSAAEQAGFNEAFPGILEGEMKPTTLLCRKHADRTLVRRFGHEKYANTLRHMRTALYTRKTKLGCEDSIERAIRALPKTPANQRRADENYIRKEWARNTEQVSLCS
ncbi:MAG: hypothetical protein J2P36_23510 [Ktedonobacteraceae bacterium]|nr:hypothetical protein [Ktedonobacteraceae bacterium]